MSEALRFSVDSYIDPDTWPSHPCETKAGQTTLASWRCGRSVRLECLGQRHIDMLWASASRDRDGFTYLAYGPFATKAALDLTITSLVSRAAQPFFAIVPLDAGQPLGWLSYCDIDAPSASIEIGSIWFSPSLRRTRAGTEALFLVLDHAFVSGFARVAWRCNALNQASRRAALRLGFRLDGTLRGVEVVKGVRRDTAWFSLLRDEWPARRRAMSTWLDDSNFGVDGRALSALERTAEPSASAA